MDWITGLAPDMENNMPRSQHMDESYVNIFEFQNPPRPHRILRAKPWKHLPRAHGRLLIIYTQNGVETSPLVEMAFQGLRHH